MKPLWEDPQNVNGGKFVLRMSKKDREHLWREVILALVGPLSEDDFTGAVLQSKPVFDTVQLWIGKQLDKDTIEERKRDLLQLCGAPEERDVTVVYIPHDVRWVLR